MAGPHQELSSRPRRGVAGRGIAGRAIAWLVAVACALSSPPAGADSGPAIVTSAELGTGARSITVHAIEFEGNHRTSSELAEAASGLAIGTPATAAALDDARQRLLDSGLFRDVRVHARPGPVPGRLVVVFTVEEARPHVRLGAGYEDISGWYLIPAQLNLDNLTGRGEAFDVSIRLGYRLSGLVSTYRRESIRDPAHFWQLRLSSEAQDRIYFLRETETAHRIGRSSLGFAMGRRIEGPFRAEAWLATGDVDVETSARVYRDNEPAELSQGDDVPFEELPADIAARTGRRVRQELGAALVLDTRAADGLRQLGVWGRISGIVTGEDDGNFTRWDADLRGYTPIGSSTLLAARARGTTVTAGTPFYDRPTLGGLYSVRGYPSQALSPPEGDRHALSASIEVRQGIIGPVTNPRLTSIAFVDVGVGWQSESLQNERASIGIGYGIRLRVPFLGRLGLDVGKPLSDSPREEAFHLNGSLGWTF